MNKTIPISNAYDGLYRVAQDILRTHNPCNIRVEDGVKVCNGNLAACCRGCKHLTTNGCSVQALGCKLWLCHEAEQRPENASVTIMLASLKTAGYAIGLPVNGYRESKMKAIGVPDAIPSTPKRP